MHRESSLIKWSLKKQSYALVLNDIILDELNEV